MKNTLLDQKRGGLVRDIERAEEEVVRSREEVKRRESEAEAAREALEKFDLGNMAKGLEVEIAAEFVKRLQEALTLEQWAEMLKLNTEEKNPSICHSHDFLDANMVMLAAMEKVLGRKMRSESDNQLWNVAWEIASKDLKSSATAALGGTSAA